MRGVHGLAVRGKPNLRPLSHRERLAATASQTRPSVWEGRWTTPRWLWERPLGTWEGLRLETFPKRNTRIFEQVVEWTRAHSEVWAQAGDSHLAWLQHDVGGVCLARGTELNLLNLVYASAGTDQLSSAGLQALRCFSSVVSVSLEVQTG